VFLVGTVGVLHAKEQFAGQMGALAAAGVLFVHHGAFVQGAYALRSVFCCPERSPFHPVAAGALRGVEFAFVTQQAAGR